MTAYSPKENPVRNMLMDLARLPFNEKVMIACAVIAAAGYATGIAQTAYGVTVAIMSHNEPNQAQWLGKAFKAAVGGGASVLTGLGAHMAAKIARGPKPVLRMGGGGGGGG